MAVNSTSTSLPVGGFLRPDRADELLQGMLNIDGAQNNVVGARLTQAELQAYNQRQFFAPDPNSNVAAYLTQNFANIAKLDGDASSISANDLVQLRQGLPTAPSPASYPPAPSGNTATQQQMYSIMFQIMQMMLQMFSAMGVR